MTDPATQKRIDDLEFENAEYRRILAGPEITQPAGIHFTPSETKLLRLLVAREVVTNDMAAAVLWDMEAVDKDWKGIKVRMCRLRRKLLALGATIHCERDIGYTLDPATRAVLREKKMEKAA